MDDDNAGTTATTDVTIVIVTMLRPPQWREIKGIICGNRCDNGEHDNQPCDDDDNLTTMLTTKKLATTLTTAVMTMTTMAVMRMAATATAMVARQ